MPNLLFKISCAHVTLSRAEATSCVYFCTTCEAWRTLGTPQEAVIMEQCCFPGQASDLCPLAAEVTVSIGLQIKVPRDVPEVTSRYGYMQDHWLGSKDSVDSRGESLWRETSVV